jgi:hypothetical protein
MVNVEYYYYISKANFSNCFMDCLCQCIEQCVEAVMVPKFMTYCTKSNCNHCVKYLDGNTDEE